MKKRDEYIELRVPSVIFRTIPIWMVLLLLVNSSMLVGFTEYYLMKKNFNSTLTELSQKTKSSEELVEALKQQVIPQKGFTLGVVWKDIGKQLLDVGVIDQEKYDGLFKNDPQKEVYMKQLNSASGSYMAIDEKNSHFMVNTLWAVGLVNKSNLLMEGQMKTYGKGDPMNYASTGGWTLGAKPTSELYASQELIPLTSEQQKLVKKIATAIYRPCCGNSTAFPDCNHGMAALGYIEVAVSQGVSEEKIYKDVLALNSFWFPQTYLEQAVYFKSQGREWSKVDAKLALSEQYSSAQGSQTIKQSIKSIPGLQTQGGGCAA